MSEPRDPVMTALQLLEQKLLRIAHTSQINALLTLGDPSLVLPSPALALLAVEAAGSCSLDQAVFRSVEPLGPDGEILFAPLAGGTAVHPWRVTSCAWSDASGEDAADGVRSGVIIHLDRDDRSMALPGWLSLAVDAGPMTPYVLSCARAYGAGHLLASRRPQNPIGVASLEPQGPRPLHFELDALLEQVADVYLPGAVIGEKTLAIELRFAEPIPAPPGDRGPAAVANAVAVWNSLPARYPDFFDVEQSVSATTHRRLHPLQPRSLGCRWRPWAISRLALPGSVPTAGQPPPAVVHHVAYTPQDGRDRLASLSIVLDRAPQVGENLIVDYLATTGTVANNVPAGAEFRAIGWGGAPVPRGVAGRIHTGSFGGHDGFGVGDAEILDADEIRALLRLTERRTIGDVASVLNRFFGDQLRLVDESDLLRRSPLDASWPVLARVAIRRPERRVAEREVLLRAAQRLLEHYLRHDAVGGIELVEVESDEEVTYAAADRALAPHAAR